MVGVAGEQVDPLPVPFHPDHVRQGRQLVGGQADPTQADDATNGGDTVVGEHPALPDDHHPLGQRLDLLQVVAGEQDRATVGVEGPDRLPQRVPGLDVEPGGRLVEQDQPGPTDEGQRHRQSPPLPAGQTTGLPPGEISQTEPVEQLGPWNRVGKVRADEVDHLTDAERAGSRSPEG